MSKVLSNHPYLIKNVPSNHTCFHSELYKLFNRPNFKGLEGVITLVVNNHS